MLESQTIPAPKAPLAFAPTPKVAATLGAVISATAVLVISGDWACSALGAAMIAALLSAILAYILDRSIQCLRARWCVLACAMILLALAQSLALRASLRQKAFVDVFGSPPPESVRDLRVARYYAGGPGDTITLLSFRDDPAFVQKLVDSLPSSQDNTLLSEYHEGPAFVTGTLETGLSDG